VDVEKIREVDRHELFRDLERLVLLWRTGLRVLTALGLDQSPIVEAIVSRSRRQ
jgi:hypothetical protein